MVHPEFEAASKSPSFELFSDSNFCGKMKVLDKLLKLFQQEKDKVLLFSYSTQVSIVFQCFIAVSIVLLLINNHDFNMYRDILLYRLLLILILILTLT